LVLVREAKFGTSVYGITGSNGSTVRAMLDGSASVQVVPDFSNASQLNDAGALWIDVGPVSNNPGLMSAAEIANLQTFIASGRRIVMIGENAYWSAWNSQLLAQVGGTFSDTDFTDSTSRVGAHQLTSGVDQVFVQAGGIAVGGTSLFAENFATLWGSQQNVLTLLDVNVFGDNFLWYEDNQLFAQNTVSWITTAVPEPSTYALGALAFVGLFAFRRSRKG
jgi:hypothetical protein